MVSTVDCNILSNPKLLSTPLHKGLTMLVINQKLSRSEDLILTNKFIDVINTNTRGLSQSRNVGLDNLKSDFLLIADDDVYYERNFEATIRESIEKFNDAAGFTYQIRTPDEKLFKKYKPSYFVHNRKSILKVSSISLLLNFARLNETGLRFDMNFGLGNKYPTGEENIFLNDLIGKGEILYYIPKVIVYHPKESSGSNINEELIFSKGALFHRMYGQYGFLAILLFLFKKKGLQAFGNNAKLLLAGVRGFIEYGKEKRSLE